jgi:2-dehydro-3-deoxygalactonokinase
MAGLVSVTEASFIAIDWGASQLKAFLCQPDLLQPKVLASASGPGVAAARGQFRQTLLQAVGDWLQQDPTLWVYMAGHITSSLGWYQTRYLNTPCSPQALLPALIQGQCPDMTLWLSTGLRCSLPEGGHDVMRGEEVQLLGLLQLAPELAHGRQLICLPGTHTKWVWLEDGQIRHFRTTMTGEVFALLTQHSVLLQGAEHQGDFCEGSFLRGYNQMRGAAGFHWLHQLFKVRTEQLFDGLTPSQASAYLSGILVGADVQGWQLNEPSVGAESQVVLAGNPRLNHCYRLALQQANYQVRTFDITAVTLAGFAWLAHEQRRSGVVANTFVNHGSCQAE